MGAPGVSGCVRKSGVNKKRREKARDNGLAARGPVRFVSTIRVNDTHLRFVSGYAFRHTASTTFRFRLLALHLRHRRREVCGNAASSPVHVLLCKSRYLGASLFQSKDEPGEE